MATIKLQPSGAVVIKDGKVACTCCEQPQSCCMYPAQALADGLYTAADLPDAITLLGVGSLAKSGTGYGDTTNGVILESGVWAKYIGGVRSTKACLIDDDGNLTPGDDSVEDQFAPTYKVTFFGGTLEIFIDRISLCVWRGSIPLPFSGWQGLCLGDTFTVDVYYDSLNSINPWQATLPATLLQKDRVSIIGDQTWDTPEGFYLSYAFPYYFTYNDPSDCPDNPAGADLIMPAFTVSLP